MLQVESKEFNSQFSLSLWVKLGVKMCKEIDKKYLCHTVFKGSLKLVSYVFTSTYLGVF